MVLALYGQILSDTGRVVGYLLPGKLKCKMHLIKEPSPRWRAGWPQTKGIVRAGPDNTRGLKATLLDQQGWLTQPCSKRQGS